MDQVEVPGGIMPGEQPRSLKATLSDEVDELKRLLSGKIGQGLISDQIERIRNLVEMIREDQKPVVGALRFETWCGQRAVNSIENWKQQTLIGKGLVGGLGMTPEEEAKWYREAILTQVVKMVIMMGESMRIAGMTGNDPELEVGGSGKIQ